MNKQLLAIGLGLFAAFLLIPSASAQEAGADTSALAGTGGIAIGAGLAVGLAGLGTGIAQANIGAAAVGAAAENDAFFGKSLVYVAIPETVVIFGLLISFLLLGNL